MTGLPVVDTVRRFAGYANELQMLRDRVAELEGLLGISGADFWKLPLAPQQKSILNVLYRAKGRLCSRDHIFSAVWGGRLECDQPEPKIIDIQLCRLRLRLKARDVQISTVWGDGWFVDDANRAKLDAWIGEVR